MGRWARKPTSTIRANTPLDKARATIERDLSLLTAGELLAKYTQNHDYSNGFLAYTGQRPEDFAPSHCPLYHYGLSVWFDNPDGRAMIGPMHKELAQRLQAYILGEVPDKDGFHWQWPRRALKTTWMMVAADWAPKRFKAVDGQDVTTLYTHNSDQKAKRRLGRIKAKNRRHKYIRAIFPDFTIPPGEWGTNEEWNWPCRDENTSVAEMSMTAMSAAAKKAGDGYNFIFMDDWEDEESRKSPVIRDSLADQYDQLRKLKAPPFTRELSQGTPYSLHSLYRTFTEAKKPDGSPRYECWVVPAADENFTKSNFPSIPSLTLDALAKERSNEMQRRGVDDMWWLQYMLKANTNRTQAMEWSWFRPMEPQEYQRTWLKLPHFRAVFCDSAWKGSEKQADGCYTAIGTIAIFQMGPVYERVLLDLVMSNSMMSDTGCEHMCRMMRKWGFLHWACEQTGDKPLVGTMRAVARQFTQTGSPITPIWLDLKGFSNKAKEDRIAMVAGEARQGRFHYLKSIDPAYIRLLAQEADTYPEDLHRDGLDMLGNSFADAVVSQYIPVSIPMGEWRDPFAEPEAPVPTIGRSIRIPVPSWMGVQ